MKYSIISLLLLFTGAVTTGCSKASAIKRDAAFEYREIYMPRTLGEDAKNIGLNSVDYDWGLWGHNLGDVLPEDPSLNVYAKVNGVTTNKQFCFSSNHLYKYLEEYITDNFGDNDSIRFAIVPNDNSIVCLCQRCMTAGNTAGDASPAVYNLVRRLANRFPGHMFFTAAYSTTTNLPTQPMPPNVGVLISAMNFPRTANTTPTEETFNQIIQDWSQAVSKVYIWDYINNFDDYFTPLPLFRIMQHRLQLYHKAGVKGLFLNGSGRDYTTLGKINAEILDSLTIDPYKDWQPMLKRLCAEYYPVSGNAIYGFMMAQDAFVQEQGKPLPMYDGVRQAVNSYLPVDDFVNFYDALVSLKERAQGQEKEELDKIVDAMSLTRLEVARITGNLDGYKDPLRRFQRLANVRNIESYNESGWSVSDYIRDFVFMANHAEQIKNVNLLKGMKIVNKTPLDEDYSNLAVLTDGMLGLPSNYHCGNLISSADPSLVLEVPYVEGAKKMRVALVSNPSYHIGLPIYVYLNYQGHRIGTAEPACLREHMGHSFVEFDLPDNVRDSMILTIVRDPESRTMALDEIELF